MASLSTSTRPPVVGQGAAVAVVGVLAEADVGDDQQVGSLPLDQPDGLLDDPRVVARRRAAWRPCAAGMPKRSTPGMLRARPPRRPPRPGGRARADTGRASRRSRAAGPCRGRRTGDKSGRRRSAAARGRGRGAGGAPRSRRGRRTGNRADSNGIGLVSSRSSRAIRSPQSSRRRSPASQSPFRTED